jgi:MFS family permease
VWRLPRDGGAPLLDLRLFRIPTFVTGVAFAVVFMSSNTGIPLVLSLYYQDGLGFAALQSGLGVSALALGSVVGAPLAGRLVTRYGRPLVVIAVSVFVTVSVVIGLVVHTAPGLTNPTDVILRLVVPLFFLGVAGGSIVTPNQTLTLMDVDPRNGGTAGGMLQTAQRVGSATGQTVLGTLFFVSITAAAATASHTVGTPSTHVEAFANALNVALLGSLVFSGAALILGITDLRRKRKARQES